MTLKDKLFGFDGRLRRMDWWALTILMGLAGMMFSETLALLVLGGDRSLFFGGLDAIARRMTDPVGIMVSAAAALPFLWPALALAAKRAHDRDKSARLVMGLTIASYILSIAPDGAFTAAGRLADRGLWIAGFFLLMGVAATIGSLYLLIVLGFQDGTPGPNRFGPSPKRRDPALALPQTEP
ncbi:MULTISPECIES: DUF805 domain-containing protein [unclassified Brevundimonas]|uniref:DUF805 domain-containing protein n=1 Tax=unclassified Brevundimonas TaxID=2622653 RepID=UPI003F9076A1